jgi:cell volume regulation protein A
MAGHFSIETILLAGCTLLITSIVMSRISSRFGIPALVIFLIIGILAGSDGPGGIYFDNAWLAQSLGVVALVVILFSGGLDTDWPSLRPVLWQGIALSTVGILLTALLVGVFAVAILKFSLLQGLLLGAIVSSTDAAAVFAVLKSRNTSLKKNLQPLLEFESGSNDPMAVFLTVSLIQLITAPTVNPLALIPSFVLQMSLGALMGFLMSHVLVWAVNRLDLEYEGLYPVLTLALVFLAYSLTATAGGSGFLAVYVMGILMGRRDFLYKKHLIRFHDGVAWLMQIVMFVAMGLLVFPSHLPSIVAAGLLISAFLIFVARPVSVFVSLALARLGVAEKLMISWVGLRGAAPIILATFVLLAKVPGAEVIFNIVFFIVLTSVILQGTTIPVVARWLKVDAPASVKRRYPIEFEPTTPGDTELVEIVVPYDSRAAGKALFELNLPSDALVTLVCRNEKFIVAGGKTMLEEGDVMLVLGNSESLKTVQAILQKQKEQA